MDRRWVCLATLGPIGVASLVYVVIVAGFIEGTPTTSSAGRCSACCHVRVRHVAADGLVVAGRVVSRRSRRPRWRSRSAYETFVGRNVELLQEPWFPLFNTLGLTADGVATRGLRRPLRHVPHRRSRATMAADRRVVHLDSRARGPARRAHDPVPPHVAVHGRHRRRHPEPVRRARLAWAAPIVYNVVQPWPSVVLGARASSATGRCSATRRCAPARASWPPWSPRRPSPSRDGRSARDLDSDRLLRVPACDPARPIHGILRYGVFDIAPGDRGRLFARSSGLLIALLYGMGSRPRVLLGDNLRSSARCS